MVIWVKNQTSPFRSGYLFGRHFDWSGVSHDALFGCIGANGCINILIHSENPKQKMVEKMYSVVEIPAGTFMMGCTFEQEDDCGHLEKPAHQVTISKDFYLMENEVTQALYERVMGENPSEFKGLNRPVEQVSWYDAVKFCNKLSQIEGLDQCYTINGNDVSWSNKSCNGWRSTEAEWEYAARYLQIRRK